MHNASRESGRTLAEVAPCIVSSSNFPSILHDERRRRRASPAEGATQTEAGSCWPDDCARRLAQSLCQSSPSKSVSVCYDSSAHPYDSVPRSQSALRDRQVVQTDGVAQDVRPSDVGHFPDRCAGLRMHVSVRSCLVALLMALRRENVRRTRGAQPPASSSDEDDAPTVAEVSDEAVDVQDGLRSNFPMSFGEPSKHSFAFLRCAGLCALHVHQSLVD